MNNLPENWGYFTARCEKCGDKFHLSGVDQCSCEECARCEEMVAPEYIEEDQTCSYCWEQGDVQCSNCGDWTLEEHTENGLCGDCVPFKDSPCRMIGKASA